MPFISSPPTTPTTLSTTEQTKTKTLKNDTILCREYEETTTEEKRAECELCLKMHASINQSMFLPSLHPVQCNPKIKRKSDTQMTKERHHQEGNFLIKKGSTAD
jgi:hypothetical protein